MRGLLPLLFADGWLGGLFQARTLAIVLWSGFALLSAALFVLMRTRWGQAKPISKCIVLSVFAHLLLTGVAYTTQLFTKPVVRESKFRLKVLRATDVDEAAPDSEPWNRFAAEADSATPELLAPDRVEAIADEEPVRPANTGLPPVVAVPHQSAVASKLIRPLPDEAETDVPPPRGKAVEATEIDVPASVSTAPEQAVATVPESPQLKRRATDDPTPSEGPHSHPAQPEKAFDIASRLQQLADVDAGRETASITHAQADDLPRVASEPSADGQPTRASSSRPSSDDPPEGPEDSKPPNFVSVDRVPDAIRSRPPSVRTSSPRRLGDGAPMPSVYRLRSSQNRVAAAKQRGGDELTEAAVEAALVWLAANQSQDGRWDASAHGAGVETQVLGHDRQGAGTDADTGITGLALLSFLGAGHTHLEGKYRKSVKRGLEFLLRSQAQDGNLCGDASLFAMMYCHGMGTLALSEAFAMTGEPRLKPYVERAVQYSIRAQHPTSGGWRYQPGDQGDMSQFGWQVMALRSARLAGIEIPERTRAGMLTFLESATSRSQPGLAAYRAGERVTPTMTAEAMTCRFFLELPRQPELEQRAAAFILQSPPANGQANLYYWYYASLAMYHIGGDSWARWNTALVPQLLDRQRTDGAEAGSWDTDTVWGSYGGRVYTTAIAALCLETYYRYVPDEVSSEWMPRDRRAAKP